MRLTSVSVNGPTWAFRSDPPEIQPGSPRESWLISSRLASRRGLIRNVEIRPMLRVEPPGTGWQTEGSNARRWVCAGAVGVSPELAQRMRPHQYQWSEVRQGVSESS